MKRRAAEVAAIKLCKDNRTFSRPSSIDKTRANKDLSTSADKSPNRRDESSSAQNKTQERKDEVTTKPRGRGAARQKSAGSEDVVDTSRRLNLRSSRPTDSRSSATKAKISEKKKKTSAGHSASSSSSSSSSESDTDENATSDTEVTPVKQRKIGIGNCLVVLFKKT